MDELAALRLQLEWGADEALLDAPVDRLAPVLVRASAAARPSAVVAVRPEAIDPRAVNDLAALHMALDGFHDCPLRGTASHTVRPSGDPAAGLVLIGEAPGSDDDRSGQAYSGGLGATMDRVLGSAGLGRDSLLLTFLVPWRPPGGRAPHDAELAMCLPFVHRLLALTAPRRLVLLGERPLRVLVDAGASLRQARGRWAEVTVPGLAPIAALPMLAPDRWLQGPMTRQNTWADLLTLREVLGTT